MAIRAAGFLAVALLLAACRPAPSPTIVPDAALMPLIPSDAVTIAGFRISALKETPVYRRLLEANKIPQLDRFKQTTGIDARKDIWEIVIAAGPRQSIALVRGKFTEGGIAGSGLEPQLEREGARRFGYKGYTLTGDDKVAVTFLNTSVAVAGSTPEVQRIIDARNGSAKPPADLIARIAEIPSSNQIYVVSKMTWAGSLPGELPPALGMLKKMPFDVRGATAALNLREGVRFSGEIQSSSDADAQRLHDAVRGVIGIGRLSAPEGQPELLRFYDAIEVKKNAAGVRVDANVPLDLFERFLEIYKDRANLQ